MKIFPPRIKSAVQHSRDLRVLFFVVWAVIILAQFVSCTGGGVD